MEAWHVYPANEEEEHYLECVYPENEPPICPCQCDPTWKEEEGAIIIVHNSFDGREVVEQANEILNNQQWKK